MSYSIAIQNPYEAATQPQIRTFDKFQCAGLEKADRIIVHNKPDQTLDLFEETIQLLDEHTPTDINNLFQTPTDYQERFIPNNEELRSNFLCAEALGSYQTLHKLTADYFTEELSQTCDSDPCKLSPYRIIQLEKQRDSIAGALENAKRYLSAEAVNDFNEDELRELNSILSSARKQYQNINEVLGIYRIHQIENAVQKLYEFNEKIKNTRKTFTGIFLVDSEIFFIPTKELIQCVDTIFDSLGNPYLAEHIDGVLLLAARNLLINAASFYSYYGREKIYELLKKTNSKRSSRTVSNLIRQEIRTLFRACKTDNRLVLTRVMKNAEYEFEMSVESIQLEAERHAIESVNKITPKPVIRNTPCKRGFFNRVLRWFNICQN